MNLKFLQKQNAILKERLQIKENINKELVQENKLFSTQLKKYQTVIMNITELQKVV